MYGKRWCVNIRQSNWHCDAICVPTACTSVWPHCSQTHVANICWRSCRDLRRGDSPAPRRLHYVCLCAMQNLSYTSSKCQTLFPPTAPYVSQFSFAKELHIQANCILHFFFLIPLSPLLTWGFGFIGVCNAPSEHGDPPTLPQRLCLSHMFSPLFASMVFKIPFLNTMRLRRRRH